MEMKIIPANGGGPGMDGVFLSGYGDGDYTPRPRSGPLPSLLLTNETCEWSPLTNVAASISIHNIAAVFSFLTSHLFTRVISQNIFF